MSINKGDLTMTKRQKRRLKRKLKVAARWAALILAIVAAFIASVVIAFPVELSDGEKEMEMNTGTEAATQEEKNVCVIVAIKNVIETRESVTEQEENVIFAPDPVFIPLPVSMEPEDQRMVFNICREYNVAFSLVMALIEHESDFDATARSSTGDSGLTQINDVNEGWLYELGFVDLMDPAQNVEAGVYILADLLERYEVSMALMAYNMGEEGAAKLWDQGITESSYSREIIAREAEFSRYLDGERMKGNE